MKYEYNGNLTEEERINLVANEIINEYPVIDIEAAKVAAMFEGKISKNITANDKLNRLYNIMLVNQNNKIINAKIFKDYLAIIKDNKNGVSDKYIDIVDKIINYFSNDTIFPIII